MCLERIHENVMNSEIQLLTLGYKVERTLGLTLVSHCNRMIRDDDKILRKYSVLIYVLLGK
jgi:hypothetical protein